MKNGVGSLRDYQNAVWILALNSASRRIDELVTQNYLRAGGARRIQPRLRLPATARPQRASLPRPPSHRPARPRAPAARRAQPRLRRAQPAPARRAVHAGLLPRRPDRLPHRQARRKPPRAHDRPRRPRRPHLPRARASLASRFRRNKHLDGFVLRGRELAAEKPTVFLDGPRAAHPGLSSLPATRLPHWISISPTLVGPSRRRRCSQRKTCRLPPTPSSAFARSSPRPAPFIPRSPRCMSWACWRRFIPEFDALTCMVQHEVFTIALHGRTCTR